VKRNKVRACVARLPDFLHLSAFVSCTVALRLLQRKFDEGLLCSAIVFLLFFCFFVVHLLTMMCFRKLIENAVDLRIWKLLRKSSNVQQHHLSGDAKALCLSLLKGLGGDATGVRRLAKYEGFPSKSTLDRWLDQS
jgi:hypothetical protein